MSEIRVSRNGKRGAAGDVLPAASVSRLLGAPVEKLISDGVIVPLEQRALGGGLLFATSHVSALIAEREKRDREWRMAERARQRAEAWP